MYRSLFASTALACAVLCFSGSANANPAAALDAAQNGQAAMREAEKQLEASKAQADALLNNSKKGTKNAVGAISADEKAKLEEKLAKGAATGQEQVNGAQGHMDAAKGLAAGH